jgi:signal transduction histidine kinase/CheY-like chemotaxis protein
MFYKKYLNKSLSLSDVLSFHNRDLAQYYFCHQGGRFQEAISHMPSVSVSEFTSIFEREFFYSDSDLLRAKIGMHLNHESVNMTSALPRVIQSYAKFTFYFWIDQEKSNAQLYIALVDSFRAFRLDFVNMTIFLIAHMRSIAGHRILAPKIAGLCQFMAAKIGASGPQIMCKYSTEVIIASYPYTNFVAANFRGMRKALKSADELPTTDPYYNLLTAITRLYSAAYAGKIIETESLVGMFRSLQAAGKILRYRPVTEMMALLPYASRGYAYLIKEKFETLVSNHKPAEFETLVNSQFYRLAAIISTALQNYTDAESYICDATRYRKQAHFQSWTHIDDGIAKIVSRRRDVAEVFKLLRFEIKATDLTLTWGFILAKILGNLSLATESPSEFTNIVGDLLCQHLGAKSFIVSDQYLATKPDSISLLMLDNWLIFTFASAEQCQINVAMLDALVPCLRNIETSVFKAMDSVRQLKEQEHLVAIAQTTQMLAHDVRKPFSLLRMGLTMLGNVKDPAGVKQVLSRIVPEIDKAMRSVDGMIADVMEVGSPSTILMQESVSPESLIESTLGELIRMYPKSNISFAYDFKHVHMTNVHIQKVGRVFSNIIGNAFQAMRNKGAMWFKTREADGMIQFCIGNSGAVIPEANLKHLFDAFFTSGKKGGTGLGLAIAQKVVTAHGGRIWCESSKTADHPDGKVEFFFTLPIANSRVNQTTALLPECSSDVANLLVMFTESGDPSLNIGTAELALEVEIVRAHSALGRALRILIIDDEGIYRSALASYFTRTVDMEEAVSLALADGSAAALDLAAQVDFDLIITDIDMGPGSLDGFELVRELRRRESRSLICVHSNRIVAADNKTAIDAGADNFLPKPMARAQFLRVVLQAAESTKSKALLRNEVEVEIGASPNTNIMNIKPGVLVVDDSPLVLCGWEDALASDTEFYKMQSIEELQEMLTVAPDFLGNLNYVVTDMHFDGSSGDGLDVGRLIKSIRPDLLVLLSSDDNFHEKDIIGAADRVIAKMPVGLSRLAQWSSR